MQIYGGGSSAESMDEAQDPRELPAVLEEAPADKLGVVDDAETEVMVFQLSQTPESHCHCCKMGQCTAPRGMTGQCPRLDQIVCHYLL